MKKLNSVPEVVEPRQNMGGWSNILCHPEVAEPRHHMCSWSNPSRHPEVAEARQDNKNPSPFAGEGRISMRGTSIRNSGEGSNSLLLGRNAQPTALSQGERTCDGFPSPWRGVRGEGNLAAQLLSRLAAFTLAEVLITLAIIGVVAAMTIPTLVAYNQEKGWDTSSTVFQRKLGEALSIMNTQQTLSGLGTTENFVAELQKHLKLIKVCDNNNLQGCFTDKVMWNDTEVDMTKVKTSKNFDKADWNTNIVGFQTASGVNALVAYNPSCKSNPYSNQIINLSGSNNQRRGSVSLGANGCLAVLYDVDGFSKPNTNTKDIRDVGGITLSISSKVCIDTGVCITKALQSGDYEPVDCTNSNSEGYEYCGKGHNYSSDYWAGAQKACNGKLASGEDLAKIANYIYNTNVFAKTTRNYDLGSGAYDSTKAQELGFPSPADFSVWFSEEYSTSATIVCRRSFYDNGSGWGCYDRADSNAWAVCVE